MNLSLSNKSFKRICIKPRIHLEKYVVNLLVRKNLPDTEIQNSK